VRVQVTERRCEVPKVVLARAQEQAEALTKYEQRATAAEIVFIDEKHTRRVEMIVHIDAAEPAIGHGEGRDFRSALDQSLDRVRRMLRENRERRRDHQAPPLSQGIVTE
jgi:ribosome-associated translation inhibitor RaiA